MKSLGKAGFGILALFIALWVIGCTSPQYKDNLQKNCVVEVQISAAKLNDSAIANSQSYAQNVYRSSAQPRWLYKSVIIKSNCLPLDLLMNKLLPSNRVGLQYQFGVDRNQPIIINYKGQIRGALDEIATQTGYAYDIKNNILTWSSYVTKTFDISFMPGASQCLKGEKENESSMNILSTINNGHAATEHINGTQFSNLQTTPSVWKDLENSIKQMLSQDGKVMVSESTTTVTVRDHPQNVQVVADYLASMNKSLSKKVLLQIQILQVSLDKNFKYGIDWNLAYKTASTGAGLSNGNSSQPVNASALENNTPFGPSSIAGSAALKSSCRGITGISAEVVAGPFKDTQLLINALSQQGSVSMVTSPEVVTLNNQVAQIDISKQTTYLSSITKTRNLQSTSTLLNPGVIDSGFKLYVLPKIMNGNVYLQLTSELSSLDSITTFQSSQSGGTIQPPTVSREHFNLRSMVPSGSTLIIAGFNQINGTANQALMIGVFSGREANQRNIETIMLITPTVLGSNN